LIHQRKRRRCAAGERVERELNINQARQRRQVLQPPRSVALSDGLSPSSLAPSQKEMAGGGMTCGADHRNQDND
jgi:hypothetical protein